MIPTFDRIDHLHVHVADRNKAEQWYADVMGFARMPELEAWADGGPLMLHNSSGTVRIALCEAAPPAMRATVALVASPEEFVAWRQHLIAKLRRPVEPEDHRLAWSLRFQDPDGNPWEITSYQHALVATMLAPAGT